MNPTFTRLTGVELRKMVDTRAGFWLQASVVSLTLVLVVLFCRFAPTEDIVFRDMFSLATAPASILLPIIGILLVSSEWSQRTALITFTLVPRRMRVMRAKLAAALLLGAVALALVLIVALVATAVVGGEWTIGATVFAQIGLLLFTGIITGIAFGALFLNSAPAIVLFFALPLGWAAIGSIKFLNTAAEWLDTTRTTAPMTERVLTGEEWAQVGTSMLLWMVLPLVVGLWRVARAEIRTA